jgi:hypothetical protein
MAKEKLCTLYILLKVKPILLRGERVLKKKELVQGVRRGLLKGVGARGKGRWIDESVWE